MALDDLTTPEELSNKRRGMAISTAVHVLLLLLALLPLLSYTDPPPGQEGIVVNLGQPDVGQGFDNAPPAAPQVEEETEAEPEEAQPEALEEYVPPVIEEEPVELVESEPREVIQTEDPEQIALRKQQEEEARKRREEERLRQQELERQRREEERRQREAEEARLRAEAEQRRKQEEADALKNEIGGLFGEGAGKGETGQAGNQGDPEGDPDASRLEGISSGAGQVGGGLSKRGVVAAPRPQDFSQNTGKVVIEVCVDASGKVSSANFTQKGSTTFNAELIGIALKNARQWRFTKGEVDRQCGTITYNFKVR